MKEIVSIFLCGKMYGVDIENIQGIENYTDVIRTGGEPGCLDGFVVIRESQSPMINLRKKLVLPPVPVTEETKILIFQMQVALDVFGEDRDDLPIDKIKHVDQEKNAENVICIG